MIDSSQPSPVTRYRLRGTIDGSERSFPLLAGENTIGFASSNRVVLAVRGVSRHHAVLEVSADGLSLRDLESRNGTLVNDHPRRLSPLRGGDELTFGPVRLRLDVLDPGDGELAVAGPAAGARGGSGLTASTGLAETTLLSAAGGQPSRAHFRLVDAVFERLAAAPEADLAGALRVLTRTLEARGASLVEWPDHGGPVVVAGFGEAHEIPTWRQVRGAWESGHEKGSRFSVSEEPPHLSAVAVSSPGDDPAGLLVWGDFPGRTACGPLLATLLRLARHFLPRATRGLRPGAPAASDPELRFPPGIVRGESPPMVALYQQLRRLVWGDVPVLILGETGVGKEHLARLLHDSSARRERPFVAVNCAAIPGDLLEAELFGIGQGVATGVRQRRGKIRQADGGSLFLDEVGDMSAGLQAKLLRVLQEKVVHPLGEAPAAVDVRVVAATHADLRRRIRDGRFREDLYYRLAGYELRVPPLRQRTEDLQQLIGHFLHRFGCETDKSVRGVTVKAFRALTAYQWPGNVRELEHEIRRLVVLCPDGQAIDSTLLSEHVVHPDVDETEPLDEGEIPALEAHLEGVERRLIRRALAHTRGNQTRAAQLLEISRNGLIKRLKRLGIDAKDFAV